MNVLYGLHHPDEGEIRLDGEPVRIDSARRAIGLGIGMVHQHFMLVPVMTVAENLVLGTEPHRGPLLDYKAAAARTRELSERFGLAVDPDAKVEDLGVGAQQRVEILRALFRGAKVLVLDEPTAVLTAQESQDLFRVLRDAEGGRDVDRLHLAQAQRGARRLRPRDRAAARQEDRHGADRGRDRAQPGAPDGRPRRAAARREDRAHAGRAAARGHATCTSTTTAGCPRCAACRSTVRAGEIVGLAGVDANGQSQLIEAITGLRKVESGIDRRRRAGHHRAQRAGGDRGGRRPHRRGPPRARPRAAVRPRREPRRCSSTASRRCRAGAGCRRGGWPSGRASCCSDYDVRGGETDTPASSLSGGNQQKVVIARELSADPKVLIAAQPTRGLDVGAIEFVHRRLVEERDKGRAILLVSLELEEVRSLSDRALVIYEGEIAAELPPSASEEEFGVVHDRRRPPRGGRVSAPEPGAAAPVTVAGRLSTYLRGGGIITPLITVLLAFFVGGLVVLVHRPQPAQHVQGDLRGHGPELVLPVDQRGGPDRRRAEPPADADRHDAADPHRPGGRVRVPLRPVQHRRPGPVPRRHVRRGLDRLVVRGDARRCCTSCFAMVARLRGRRGVGRHRRPAAGHDRRQRGDLDDHAQLDRDLDRACSCSASAARCRATPTRRAGVERHRRGRQAAGVLGRSASSRACTSACSSRSRRLLVFWVILNRTRTGFEVRAVGFNPEAARSAGISVGRNYVLVMAICGLFAGLAGSLDVLGWQFRRGDQRHPDLRTSASSASPSRCSGATPRSARCSRRCCSARS